MRHAARSALRYARPDVFTLAVDETARAPNGQEAVIAADIDVLDTIRGKL